jgi:hypothetical protein
LESDTGITKSVLARFIATYPEVNIEWLIAGKGEILKAVSTTTETNIDYKEKYIKLMEKYIELTDRLEDSDIESIKKGNSSVQDLDKRKGA